MINFSELLWKPQRVARERVPTDRDAASAISEEATELQHVPVREVRIRPESRIVLLNDPRSPGADRFRFLRMRLREFKNLANLRSILITSPLPQDGKSTVALNLATVLAEKGKRSVLLIDADLHRHTLAQSLELPAGPGLGECLKEGIDVLTVLQRLEPLGWYFLPAGAPQSHPTELLQSDTLSLVMQRLSPLFEWIIIDTPPVTPLTDAVLLSQHVDASLLVVRADRTPQESIEHALGLLGKKHVLGILLNAAEGLNQRYSGYRGYYSNKK